MKFILGNIKNCTSPKSCSAMESYKHFLLSILIDYFCIMFHDCMCVALNVILMVNIHVF